MKILVTNKFQGQLRAYGDYLYEYLIETDCNEEEIINFVHFVLNKQGLPNESEYKKNIESNFDMGYYATGYYTLNRTEAGWLYTIHEPYMD